MDSRGLFNRIADNMHAVAADMMMNGSGKCGKCDRCIPRADGNVFSCCGAARRVASGMDFHKLLHGRRRPFLRITGCQLLTDVFTRETAYWAWCPQSCQLYKIGKPSA